MNKIPKIVMQAISFIFLFTSLGHTSCIKNGLDITGRALPKSAIRFLPKRPHSQHNYDPPRSISDFFGLQANLTLLIFPSNHPQGYKFASALSDMVKVLAKQERRMEKLSGKHFYPLSKSLIISSGGRGDISEIMLPNTYGVSKSLFTAIDRGDLYSEMGVNPEVIALSNYEHGKLVSQVEIKEDPDPALYMRKFMLPELSIIDGKN